MNRPVIGITTGCGPDPNDPGNERTYVNRLYADCLVEAGAAPVLLTRATPVESIVPLLDGLLIPGGDDIDASQFGAKNHPMVKLEDPGRYVFEKALLDALPQEAPVLGICYGCQMINVYRGGSLVQHIPDVAGASQHTGGVEEKYMVEPTSRLEAMLGSQCVVGKSYHHQANAQVGEGLKVTARSEDGMIEGIEDAGGRWLFGVQWHPERTPDSEATKNLFKAFVDAATRYRQGRRA
ncbi:MAG TPA: gamma-glutamyl-gamma-aminobutyrate hydrolase family protein [Fimbriimonadaceae bacterium]|nr:gamma-glutamyl-gamma-aminobutyrate hydrolase family protein [Fimbriimonadaceae bacterium]